jgi:hypothetical protein
MIHGGDAAIEKIAEIPGVVGKTILYELTGYLNDDDGCRKS